jgi:transcriptional regulator with XRE-family HTH domain
MPKSIHTPEYRLFLTLLRKQRDASELSQEQVASKLGLTQSAYSKFERGERRIDLVELAMICRALNVSLVSFVEQFDQALHTSSQRDQIG